MSTLFGPSGNSQAFYDAGLKHTYQAPKWVFEMGLDAYEYSAGNGITGSLETFAKIGAEAKKYNIKTSFHTPYYISLSGQIPEKRLKSLSYIGQSLDAGFIAPVADGVGPQGDLHGLGSGSALAGRRAGGLGTAASSQTEDHGCGQCQSD